MRVHNDLPGQLPVGAQKRQCAASRWPVPQRLFPSIPDYHTTTAGVVANVVGVVGEPHRLQKLKRGSVVNPGGAIGGSDVQTIGRSVVKLSLRLLQVGKSSHP